MEPARQGTLLDLLFVNQEGLVGYVTFGGHLGHSDCKMIEFSVVGEVKRRVSRTATWDSPQTDFGQFQRLVNRVP